MALEIFSLLSYSVTIKSHRIQFNYWFWFPHCVSYVQMEQDFRVFFLSDAGSGRKISDHKLQETIKAVSTTTLCFTAFYLFPSFITSRCWADQQDLNLHLQSSLPSSSSSSSSSEVTLNHSGQHLTLFSSVHKTHSYKTTSSQKIKFKQITKWFKNETHFSKGNT